VISISTTLELQPNQPTVLPTPEIAMRETRERPKVWPMDAAMPLLAVMLKKPISCARI
jgi:hypothetical protein